jgi:hypothetical protein
MRTSSVFGVVFSVVCAAAAFAQNAGTTPLGEQTPAQNVTGAAVRERAPSTWVSDARARHAQLMDERLRAARFGTRETAPQESAGGGTTGSGGLDLLGLLDQFTGGAGLGDLLGGLTGTSGTTTGTQGGGDLGGLFPNVPPEVLEMIQNSGIDLTPLLNQAQTINPQEPAFEGDAGIRAQQRNDGQGSFAARLGITLLETALEQTISQIANFNVAPLIDLPEDDPSMLRESLIETGIQLLFTALTFEMSSADFVNTLADLFRPAFGLPLSTDVVEPGRAADEAENTPAEPAATRAPGGRAGV